MNTFTKKLLITTGLIMGLATGANALNPKMNKFGMELTMKAYVHAFPNLSSQAFGVIGSDVISLMMIDDRCRLENFKGQNQMVEHQQCIVDSVFWRKFIVQKVDLMEMMAVAHYKMKLGVDDKYKARGVGKQEWLRVGNNLLDKYSMFNGGKEVKSDEWLIIKVSLKTTILNNDKHISLIYWRDDAGELQTGVLKNEMLWMDDNAKRDSYKRNKSHGYKVSSFWL